MLDTYILHSTVLIVKQKDTIAVSKTTLSVLRACNKSRNILTRKAQVDQHCDKKWHFTFEAAQIIHVLFVDIHTTQSVISYLFA